LNRVLKVIGSIFFTIVVGAIGSGVWEKLLSPAISRLSGATVSAIASISTSYEDSIYQRAARDTTDLYPLKITFLILLIVGLTLAISFTNGALSRSSLHERLQSRVRLLFGVQGLSGGLALVVVAFIFMAKIDAASRVREASLRSLEILRPALGEAKYFEMKSDYYSIETKRDFQAFKSKALAVAVKTSRKVPLQQIEN
jgi:hypothetical protein